MHDVCDRRIARRVGARGSPAICRVIFTNVRAGLICICTVLMNYDMKQRDFMARHPEDVGRTVEDFNWVLNVIVRPVRLGSGMPIMKG